MTTKTKSETVNRRGFLAAVGVGVAATAIPAGALEAMAPADGGVPLDVLRAWYRREIERLAGALRVDFQAGKYRGHRSKDFEEEDDDEGLGWSDYLNLPFCRLEHVVDEYFRLTEEGDPRPAFAILTVSPNVARTDPGRIPPYSAAREAAALDVLAVARARGWSATSSDEFNPELEVLS